MEDAIALAVCAALAPKRKASTNSKFAADFAARAIVANEEKEFLGYLRDLRWTHPIATNVERFWHSTKDLVGLRTPVAIPDDNGGIHIAWDDGRHYVDADFLPTGEVEWFYRDRTDGTLDGTEEPVSPLPVPDELARRLTLVAAR